MTASGTISGIAWALTARVGLGLILGIVAGGCAPIKDKSVVKECVLPSDQVGTLTGKWQATPIPIAFHQGDFAADEVADMIAAADTWNEFYATSLNLSPIDYGTSGSPRTSTQPRPNNSLVCSGSITASNGYTGAVVIYKNGYWPFPSQPNAMALTSFCRTSASPLPYFYMATIDLNYQNFFVSGKKVPDLQTIILHELGHLLGLGHSCETSARTGVPDCSAGNLNPAYSAAVMFPVFGWDAAGFGEQKRETNSNDQGRANCLYQ